DGRNRGGIADAPGVGDAPALVCRHGFDDLVKAGGAQADGYVQGVSAGGDEFRGDPLHVLDGKAAGREFVGGNADDQRPLPDGLLDALDDAPGKVQAPFLVATPGVVPMIEEGSEKSGQQIAVGGVQFKSLVTGLDAEFRGVPETFDQVLDLVVVECAGSEPIRDRKSTRLNSSH